MGNFTLHSVINSFHAFLLNAWKSRVEQGKFLVPTHLQSRLCTQDLHLWRHHTMQMLIKFIWELKCGKGQKGDSSGLCSSLEASFKLSSANPIGRKIVDQTDRKLGVYSCLLLDTTCHFKLGSKDWIKINAAGEGIGNWFIVSCERVNISVSLKGMDPSSNQILCSTIYAYITHLEAIILVDDAWTM